jgi:hypothetical protein
MSTRYSTRDPLTLSVARTLRETRRDPYDWWESFERPLLKDRRSRSAARRLRRAWRNFWRWFTAPSPWEGQR